MSSRVVQFKLGKDGSQFRCGEHLSICADNGFAVEGKRFRGDRLHFVWKGYQGQNTGVLAPNNGQKSEHSTIVGLNLVRMRRFALLFIVMFLQFAIWGAWLPIAQTYFQGPIPAGLGLNGNQLGILFALMPACSILMSPIFGQLADRVFHPERLMAVLHLLSGVSLLVLLKQTTFAGTFFCLLIHCLIFSPTVSLSTTVALHHLDDPSRQFGNIRVAGTIGWMVAGWILFAIRTNGSLHIAGDLFVVAAALSFILSFFCFLLRKTPPSKEDSSRYAFGKALKLFNNTNFMMLMVIAFVICTQFDFFYMFTPGYLTAPTADTLRNALPESYLAQGGGGLGVPVKQVPFIMSLAQLSEIVMMVLLPFLIRSIGYKWTIFMGIVAWVLRFAIYVFFASFAATIASIMLHGFCIACFLIAGSLYVAEIAPNDIRASAQALYSMVTFGFGRVIGAILGGYIETVNTIALPVHVGVPGFADLDKIVNWQGVFAIPTGMTFICAVAFPFLFRPKKDVNPVKN